MGPKSNLIEAVIPTNPLTFEVDQDAALETARQISIRFMKLLYMRVSTPLGRCLLDAGMCGRLDTEGLTRMIRASCIGAHRAALEEAEKIAAEHRDKALLS